MGVGEPSPGNILAAWAAWGDVLEELAASARTQAWALRGSAVLGWAGSQSQGEGGGGAWASPPPTDSLARPAHPPPSSSRRSREVKSPQPVPLLLQTRCALGMFWDCTDTEEPWTQGVHSSFIFCLFPLSAQGTPAPAIPLPSLCSRICCALRMQIPRPVIQVIPRQVVKALSWQSSVGAGNSLPPLQALLPRPGLQQEASA